MPHKGSLRRGGGGRTIRGEGYGVGGWAKTIPDVRKCVQYIRSQLGFFVSI